MNRNGSNPMYLTKVDVGQGSSSFFIFTPYYILDLIRTFELYRVYIVSPKIFLYGIETKIWELGGLRFLRTFRLDGTVTSLGDTGRVLGRHWHRVSGRVKWDLTLEGN